MKKLYIKLFVLSVFFAVPGKMLAGNAYVMNTDTATDTMDDNENKQPLAFASVAILGNQGSALINGVVTDKNGKFLLKTPRSNFMVRIENLSYEPRYFSDFSRYTKRRILNKIFIVYEVVFPQGVCHLAECSCGDYSSVSSIISYPIPVSQYPEGGIS